MALKGGESPLEMIIWDIAEKFGWTLEYIDSLSVQKLHDYLQIQDAKIKVASGK